MRSKRSKFDFNTALASISEAAAALRVASFPAGFVQRSFARLRLACLFCSVGCVSISFARLCCVRFCFCLRSHVLHFVLFRSCSLACRFASVFAFARLAWPFFGFPIFCLRSCVRALFCLVCCYCAEAMTKTIKVAPTTTASTTLVCATTSECGRY